TTSLNDTNTTGVPSYGTAPTLTSQTPISTGTAPTLTSQMMETPVSTGTAPTLTSQLTQTPISTVQPVLMNVAFNKTAMLSTIWSPSYPASNAVDGNTNTNWYQGKSCTSTRKETGAWWKVDLGANYLVFNVILTNRQGCCETRILNSEVRIGLSDFISNNTRCGELVTLEQTSQSDIVFECDSPIVGRYASLQLVDRTDLLNLCEMQVMAIENIAVNGIASQSTTASGGLPVRAIDGNDSSMYGQESCMHTIKQLNSWWKVDLESTYDIFKVVITNRGDCCEDRIDGAVVLIGDDPHISQNHQCGVQIDWNSNTYEERIPFDCQLSGRYVGVQLKDHNNWLTLCEVEVYGS
ncbi:uncharacterized protein LOC102805978, partial [Saccoglossus kowalevskii]|uniref:Uncharacterized protein LOC102805978 n=1 Tax=Saccoglossus kowalevskii TaxID=10224 RepID=A0ABM0MJI4_SACKO